MVPYESGFAHRMMEAHPRLAYIFPEEGSPVVPMTWAIAKGAPNVEAARVALSYAVKPEAQAQIVESLNWYPANPAAADAPGASDKVKRFSAQVSNFARVDRVKIDAHRPEWVERFKREVASR
jgi:ABC-type Fe3+ transport system substrate-binding protein